MNTSIKELGSHFGMYVEGNCPGSLDDCITGVSVLHLVAMESSTERMPVGSVGQLLVMVVMVGMCIWYGDLCVSWAAVWDELIDTDNDSHNVSNLSWCKDVVIEGIRVS